MIIRARVAAVAGTAVAVHAAGRTGARRLAEGVVQLEAVPARVAISAQVAGRAAIAPTVCVAATAGLAVATRAVVSSEANATVPTARD